MTGSYSGTVIGSATIKYDSKGKRLWAALYSSAIITVAIAVDADGYVYVTGGGFSRNYITPKYDAEGNQVWLETSEAAIPSYDTAAAMVLDTDGNIYVTGSLCRVAPFGRCTGNSYTTIKYVQK